MRRFSNFIGEIRRGDLDEELSVALANVVKEVNQQQKAGSLDLKIKITPNKLEGTVFIQALVNEKPPKSEPGQSIFYIDKDNQLRREDPRQMSIGDLEKAGQDSTSQTPKEA